MSAILGFGAIGVIAIVWFLTRDWDGWQRHFARGDFTGPIDTPLPRDDRDRSDR